MWFTAVYPTGEPYKLLTLPSSGQTTPRWLCMAPNVAKGATSSSTSVRAWASSSGQQALEIMPRPKAGGSGFCGLGALVPLLEARWQSRDKIWEGYDRPSPAD